MGSHSQEDIFFLILRRINPTPILLEISDLGYGRDQLRFFIKQKKTPQEFKRACIFGHFLDQSLIN